MADVDTSVYNRPAPPNPLDSITKLGGAMDALGGIATGQAVQGAMGPDGQIDQNALARLLTQSPAGAARAIPTLHALQQLKSAGFATDQAGLETFQKRMAITHHLFSGLASKERPTIDDVHDVAAKALDPALEAYKYGITMPVIMNAIKSFRGRDGKPLPPDQIREKALEIQTHAAQTSEILHQHSPGYQIVDQGGQLTIVPTGTAGRPAMGTAVPKGLPPGTPVYPPGGGAPQLLGPQPPIPGGGVVRPAPQGGGIPYVPPLPRAAPGTARPAGGLPPPGAPTGPLGANPPGFDVATGGVAGQSATSANELTRANDTSMTRKAMLGNLEDHLRKFRPGPGAETEKLIKSFAVRNLPVPETWKERGAVFDVGSIADQEQFNKQAMMLAQQQFATIGGTGTDAKFGSAFETSPNQALSTLGNQGIIRLLKGNEDAIQAKNRAWQAWKRQRGPQTFDEFSADFNQHFDPRSFQFTYMNKDERQEYFNAMDSDEERQRFLSDLTHARMNKWIRFDQPAAKK